MDDAQFSTATGTPLHPDKSERDLLAEAKREAEKALRRMLHTVQQQEEGRSMSGD